MQTYLKDLTEDGNIGAPQSHGLHNFKPSGKSLFSQKKSFLDLVTRDRLTKVGFNKHFCPLHHKEDMALRFFCLHPLAKSAWTWVSTIAKYSFKRS